MQSSDIDEEIEKLKSRKQEIANRINMTRDFGEKEDLQLESSRIQKQIDALERFRKK